MSILRVFALGLVLLGTGSVAAAQKDSAYIPDIETFLQIGAVGSPAVAAEGLPVVFTGNMSGVNQLYRLTPEGWPYQLTVFPDGVDFYSLSEDGRSAIVGVSVGGNEQSQLFLVDVMTGRPRQLTDQPEVQHGSVLWARDGKSLFYRSNEANGRDFHVYRRTLATGEARAVYEGKGTHAPEALSHDGRWLVVGWYESNENGDLFLVDLSGRSKVRRLTPHEGKISYQAGGFSADDKRLYLITNDNPEGLQRLAVMDLQDGRMSYPLPASTWEVEGGSVSPDGRFLAAIYNEEGYGRLHLYEAATLRELPVPPLEGIVDGVALSNQETAVISFSSPTRAPNVWLWDWRAPELKRLTHTSYAGIDPGLFRDPLLVKIKSFDGLEVPAFLYLPPDYQSGKPVPFVIDIHGGPESQFRPGFIRNFQYLMLNGYGVLAPNVRGSSGYGRAYQALDNYTLRMNSVKDAGACGQWLIEEGYTTRDMLGVRGGSYGGFMVLACITEFPDLFAAAIDVVGVANFQTFLKNTADYRRALREAEYGPLSDPEFLDSISPIFKVDLIKTPLLVIHGENDPRVPVAEARQIAQAIAKRGGVVDTLIFPDEGHGAAKRPNVLREYRTHVDFFDRYLKKAEPVAPAENPARRGR